MQIRLGIDLSKHVLLDSLTIEAGTMLSFELVRGLTGWGIPQDFVAGLYVDYKQFGLRNTFYAGQGHHLDYGDAFYSKQIYNRLDAIWQAFSYAGVSGKFVFSLHSSPGYAADAQEAFSLTYDLGRKHLHRFR